MRVHNACLTDFARRYCFPGADTLDYRRLHRASLDDPGRFWRAVWDYCGVLGEPGERVFEAGCGMRDARFFPEARLNFARNLLAGKDTELAIIAWSESTGPQHINRGELRRRALAFGGWLKTRGVHAGDHVVALLPNVPETVVAMLGATAIGAVFSSASPDFGAAGALDRFGQLAPKVLVACAGYRYNGRFVDCCARVREIADGLPGLAATVIVDPHGDTVIDGATRWADARSEPDGEFVELPYDHPLYVMYSSGTTGPPKAIVHGCGGTLLQHLKEHRLQCDIGPGDRVFYFTTCGWMMWNWLASVLATGAAIVLYDGSPSYPGLDVLFDMAEAETVTFFGTSARFIDALRKDGREPCRTHRLTNLRTIGSTGSPLAPESFDYVYASIKADVQLASISGGTDILSCFVGANPWGSVRRGEIQAAQLGMATTVFDENGVATVGERGELVCTQAFPSMPLSFVADEDGERYRRSYFDRWPDVWRHGDFAIETAAGGFVILGRSDAVLNPGGVRIGTAEIYRQVERIDAVLESLAIGQEWDGYIRVVLFVVLRPGIALDGALEADIRGRIRSGATPRHVPARIVAVPEIPRTKSGKLTELAVRAVVHGRTVTNTDALANPAALEHFRGLPELAR